MGVRGKTLIVVLLTGAVVGVYSLQTSNPNLFKGQIFNDPAAEEAASEETSSGQPDLRGKLEIINPASDEEDLKVSATIENIGTGELAEPFKYTIYINDQEVFSNTDSYTTMAPGDSFNFVYPIPKTIYNYPNSGTVKFVLDGDDDIEESNEENNETEMEYSF